ncbi:hypothetical protein Tco_0966279 [Tanacetum coccineum]
MPTDPHHTPTIIPPSTSQPQRKQRPRKTKRKDTEIPQSSVLVENVADEAVYEERDDRVNTPRSGEDSLQLKELMEFCTKLQQRVLDLENTKTAQAQEITSLKKRVKKLERKKIRRCHPNWGGKIDVIDADEDHHPGRKCHDADCFECMILMCCQRFIDVDMTLTQDNANLKSTKHKAVTILLTTTTTAELKTKLKGLLFKRRSMASTPITSSKDKGKGIMVEEPLKIRRKIKSSLIRSYKATSSI